jgi:pimeloyl-ACP methyl ester carboxylesterase
VAPLLAESLRVVSYDRRGYGRSARPPGARLRRQDEDDLEALIKRLGWAPAHVAGNSFGASTALALCARRPELFRSLNMHEPPLIEAASESSRLRPILDEVRASIGAAVEQLRTGDIAGGARLRRGRRARPRRLGHGPARGARAAGT